MFRSYPIVKSEKKWGQTDTHTDRQTTPTRGRIIVADGIYLLHFGAVPTHDRRSEITPVASELKIWEGVLG